MVDARWPGSELFDIVHLNGKAIVKINHRHPFWKNVYGPIKKTAAAGTTNSSAEDLIDVLRKAEAGIDALVLAYAKPRTCTPTPPSLTSCAATGAPSPSPMSTRPSRKTERRRLWERCSFLP